MNAGKRVAIVGALLLAGSLAALPAVASAVTTEVPRASSGDTVSQGPALHGRSSDASSAATRANTSREVKLLQALEAVAIKQLDFQQVQGLEIQLTPLRAQTKRP